MPQSLAQVKFVGRAFYYLVPHKLLTRFQQLFNGVYTLKTNKGNTI